MTATKTAKNLPQYKIKFYLIVGQILDFGLSPSMIWEKNYEVMFCVIEYSHLDSYIYFNTKL